MVTEVTRPAARASGATLATVSKAPRVGIPWLRWENSSVTITTRLTSCSAVCRARSNPRSLSTSPM